MPFFHKESNAKREMLARIRQAYQQEKSQKAAVEPIHSDSEDVNQYPANTDQLDVTLKTNEDTESEVVDATDTEFESKAKDTTGTESKPKAEHLDRLKSMEASSTSIPGSKVESQDKHVSSQMTNIINDKVEEELNTFLDDLENSEFGAEPYIECRFWDFAGQKDYYATHQIFLNPHVLCLLVVDIMTDIKKIDTTLNFDDIGGNSYY